MASTNTVQQKLKNQSYWCCEPLRFQDWQRTFSIAQALPTTTSTSTDFIVVKMQLKKVKNFVKWTVRYLNIIYTGIWLLYFALFWKMFHWRQLTNRCIDTCKVFLLKLIRTKLCTERMKWQRMKKKIKNFSFFVVKCLT